MRYRSLILAILISWPALAASAETIEVESADAIRTAIMKAEAGDTIVIAPGTYKLGGKIKTRRAGTADQPIVVKAESLGDVHLRAGGEQFVVAHPHWTFENLHIEGACSNDSWCEHAFHIIGNASHTIISNNILREYNAAIKGNGLPDRKGGGMPYFPNDVIIEGNYFYNSDVRATRNPVTPVDVMGGLRWIVRDNFFADFAKGQGNKVSYAAFLKGNSRDGVFERNLVICEWKHSGGIRLGLSFGGGGTGLGAKTCMQEDCSVWHTDGIMRNNVVMNCTEDVGIYLSRARDSKIYNNTLFNVHGIDVRFPESSAEVRNNIISGSVREREGGTARVDTNLIAGSEWSQYIPAVSRYVQRRLEGQDVKYPSLVATADVRWAQSLVDQAFEFVADTALGKGTMALDDIFADPANLDFDLVAGEEVVDKGVPLPEVTDDFCGRSRDGTPDIGAIEYSAGPCNLRAKFPLLDSLPRRDARSAARQ